MASDIPVLEIRNLHAGIDDTPILRGIELEIPAGEIHAIMGRNGSGKTTTANIIMGHPDFEVTDGGVQLDGENLLGLRISNSEDERCQLVPRHFLDIYYPMFFDFCN